MTAKTPKKLVSKVRRSASMLRPLGGVSSMPMPAEPAPPLSRRACTQPLRLEAREGRARCWPAHTHLEVGARLAVADLRLAREVVPAGYVSMDTHVHTLTHSGHGDSTAEERAVTLAGEGIALPVATEHNRHADYAPAARATGTARCFTPVVGNEVTTPVGHFNAFPFRADSPPPAFDLKDRARLLGGIRATPDAKVVILNHPCDVHAGFRPTDPARFHPLSGESLDGQTWDFDGIEVITSGAAQADFMRPYRVWFALLNRGARTVGP